MFPAVVALAGVAISVLATVGVKTMIDSRLGRVDGSAVFGLDEPGYLAFVSPTPTLLVLHAHDGSLVGVTLLAHRSSDPDSGGAALLLPANLLLDPVQGGTQAELLGDVYASGGVPAVERALEGLLGFGFDEVVEATRSDLASAMAQIGPVPYQLDNDLLVVDADGIERVVHSAGVSPLSAEAVADIYGFRNPDEAAAYRVERQRSVWQAWLQALSLSDAPDAAVLPPGLTLYSLSPFLRALLAQTSVAVVHVRAVEVAGVAGEGSELGDGQSSMREAYVVDDQAMAWLQRWVDEHVPWPKAPVSFWRPTVQVLDGIGGSVVRDSLVHDLIAAGGVVTVVGNAAEFGRAETLVTYHTPEAETVATAMAIALRAGDRAAGMAYVDLSDDEEYLTDITVTIGMDLASP